MLTASLPNQIDIRKWVVKGAEISVETPIAALPRVVDLLASDRGSLAITFQFYRDEGRFRRVDGHLLGSVEMVCQRCLEPMAVAVDTRFELAIVWSEKDAERLPKSLEPLIVGEELVDLADIVSEELILSLPYVNYHEASDCHQRANYSCVDPDAVIAVAEKDNTRVTKGEPEKENPFNILEKLKFDK